MCGVIACRTAAPAVDYLITALRRLEYRGYDSAGIAALTDRGDIATVRVAGRVAALEARVRDWHGPALDGLGIGHTRWATHGSVSESNAHPHADCTGELSLVHNGIIANAAELRARLTAAGHRFATCVDSEVLVHLVEEQMPRYADLYGAVRAALDDVRGSWALAVMSRNPASIVVAAQASPLIVASSSEGDFATSDVAAVSDWAHEFRVLEDGDVVELTGPRRWSHGDVDSPPPVAAPCTWRGSDIGLDGYSDYMAKEIDEQPEIVAGLLDRWGSDIATPRVWESLGLPPFQVLEIVGCGTSFNAGRVIASMSRQLGGTPTHVSVASEAAGELSGGPDTLWLAISQSGETADVLQAVHPLLRGTSSLLALTNSLHSTLARRADTAMMCVAGPEIGVAATKTFVAQIVAGAVLVISASVAMDRLSSAEAMRAADRLRGLPDRLAAATTAAKCLVPSLVEKLTDQQGFVFISRGRGVPYAAEGALKLKELTYRWTEHCAAGELKHGPLALIADGTPVVVVDSGEPTLADNIAEVRARGGRIIDIGARASALPVPTDETAPWGPLEAIVPLQVFARALALALGCDVDKPRNLAKSVTV